MIINCEENVVKCWIKPVKVFEKDLIGTQCTIKNFLKLKQNIMKAKSIQISRIMKF